MKRRTTTETRPRPKLPRIPEEMRQWSALLLHEISGWADVSSKPMFGMKAVYQDKAIFGVLPRTRTMDTAYSVSFKIPRRNIALSKSLNADPRILLVLARRNGSPLSCSQETIWQARSAGLPAPPDWRKKHASRAEFRRGASLTSPRDNSGPGADGSSPRTHRMISARDPSSRPENSRTLDRR